MGAVPALRDNCLRAQGRQKLQEEEEGSQVHEGFKRRKKGARSGFFAIERFLRIGGAHALTKMLGLNKKDPRVWHPGGRVPQVGLQTV